MKTALPDKPTAANATNSIDVNDAANDQYGETQRTVNRYRESLQQMKDVLKNVRGDWKAFQFSELEAVLEDIDPSKLRGAINDVFQRNDAKVKSRTRWAKCKKVIEVIYTALSPVIQNLLVIVRDSSVVRISFPSQLTMSS